MQTFDIIFYEGQLGRTLEINKARQTGQQMHRPWGFRTKATFPIVPRPGDRIFFKLYIGDTRYFPNKDTADDCRVKIDAEVKFVELEDGIENIYIHCTDPGYGEYGRMTDEQRKEIEEMVGDAVSWK